MKPKLKSELIGVFLLTALVFLGLPTNIKAATEFGKTTAGSATYPDMLQLSGTATATGVEDYFDIGAVDTTTNKGYFFVESFNPNPTYLVKFDLTTMTREASHLFAVNHCTYSTVIDYDEHVLLATMRNPATGHLELTKIDLDTLDVLDTLDLGADDGWGGNHAAVLHDGYGYFGSANTPGDIYKVNLSTFTLDDTLALSLPSANGFVIDTTTEKLYATATNFSNTDLYQIDLATFTLEDTITFSAAGSSFMSSLIHDGYLYNIVQDASAVVTKIDLSTFTEVDTLAFPNGQYAQDMELDSVNEKIYLGAYEATFFVIDIDTFALEDTIQLPGYAGEANQYDLILDSVNGYLYSALYTAPSKVARLNVNNRNYIKASKFTLSEDADNLDSLSIYSHASGGNVRLAIYDEDKDLLWESASTANTASADWLDIPVTGNISLSAGDYYLAFQTDTFSNFASYTAGSSGDGFQLLHSYSAFDASIAGETDTAEVWSLKASYSQDPVVVAPASGGGGLPPQAFTPPIQGVNASYAVTKTSQSGSQITLSLNTSSNLKNYVISNSSDFNDAVQKPITPTLVWDFCKTAGCTNQTAYIKFYNEYGQQTETLIIKRDAATPSSRLPATSVPNDLKSLPFLRNLRIGMSGADVLSLQKILNSLGFTVATSGAGSAGQETRFFGILTYNAVIKFQEVYRQEILAPLGLIKGNGFFGPATRAKLNSLLQ